MSDETTTAWCAGCQALGVMPTPEHLADVAASEKRRVAAMRVQSAEDENARLRERVAALEAAGETMLDLLTGHTHGVMISPQAVRDALGDWLAARALAGEGHP